MSVPARLTINLDALVDNWKTLRDRSGAKETAAVVKANAYGLGLEEVGKALTGAGCKTFFVATADEGVRLRDVAPSQRIFLLNGVMPENSETIRASNLIPVLSNLEMIDLWVETAQQATSALHVDTGMNRLGLMLDEARSISGDASKIEAAGIGMLISHLACADDPEHEKNANQLASFGEAAKLFPQLEKSLANSAGLFLSEDYHYDLARPGISLYGAEAVNDVPNPMEPVVHLEARILQVRQAKIGETVGYGATVRLERDTKIAICGIGYADGYHRSLSGSGVPLRGSVSSAGFGAIDGKRVPLLGRVSMDLTAFDVTDIPESTLANTSWVELIGPTCPLDDVARACGTIGYELLTDLGGRYVREYVGL